MEVNKKKHTENLIKMKIFHNVKCKPYPHNIFNTSKWVIRNRELSIATSLEIKAALGKDYKRIIIRRGTDEIQTHLSILTFKN